MNKEIFEKLLTEGSTECTVPQEFLKEVKEALKGSITDGKYVAFWGSVFSNFFPCHFTLNRKEWTSSEKYFMYMKAVTFGDEKVAKEIYKLDDPRQIKEFGRKVKNYDDNVWDEVREQIMYNAVKAKFEQDGLCNYCILEYPHETFIEGNPYDKIWGVGIKFNDNRIFDKTNWNGKNLLGKILTKVRDEIIEQYKIR